MIAFRVRRKELGGKHMGCNRLVWPPNGLDLDLFYSGTSLFRASLGLTTR